MEVQVETLDTHEAKLTIAFDDATIAKTRRDVAEGTRGACYAGGLGS